MVSDNYKTVWAFEPTAFCTTESCIKKFIEMVKNIPPKNMAMTKREQMIDVAVTNVIKRYPIVYTNTWIDPIHVRAIRSEFRKLMDAQ